MCIRDRTQSTWGFQQKQMTTEDNKGIILDIIEDPKESSDKENNSAAGNSVDGGDERLNTTEQLELQTYKKRYTNINIAEVKSNNEICKDLIAFIVQRQTAEPMLRTNKGACCCSK
eukprot:TRINITY_DN735_c0_g6_i2.p2 TRINITY_DN735_c0_g6~~TRINITY_DN735_c0_g6_i2.p2  ORF type:complete len:116 (+),score=34.48 TRINITY_DN735_c0_g6_i2:78-425(+)